MKQASLDLGGITFPLDAITQTFGIIAMRGAGKSNAAAAMAEEMAAHGLPFVVIDPVGSWYGLRSSADGTGPGYQVPIFGGDHGDVPLERTGGVVLADLIVDQRLSAILDVSEFSKADRTRFLTDFAERLYKRNRDPLHLFLEEADDYAPQRPMPEQRRCLGAWDTIVRRGRSRGLGITMITQRAAVINKDILTQIETLIVLRLTSPQDRKAVSDWVQHAALSGELVQSLPALKNGEGWVWSPFWLGRTEAVQFRRRRTFDSGATPKGVDRNHRPSATLADVDLAAVRKALAATIERSESEDPKRLRAALAAKDRQVAELEALVGRLEKATTPTVVDRPVALASDLATLQQVWASIKASLDLVTHYQPVPDGGQVQIVGTNPTKTSIQVAFERVPRKAWVERQNAATHDRVDREAAPAPATPKPSGTKTLLPRAEHRILVALAQYHPRPRGVGQVSTLTGYAPNGGGFRNALGSLRRAGFIVGSDRLEITAAGLEALGPFDPLPRGAALLDYWMHQLPKAERSILEVLATQTPGFGFERGFVAAATGYAEAGGGFRNALGKLRRLDLITGSEVLILSQDLFD